MLRSLRRLGAAMLVSTLALGLLAGPGAAATTRVVDDDGKGSATNCNASAKAFTSVQKAVVASGPGDTVKVCPGTYVGKVRIKGARAGLKLVSTKPRGATIKDPSVYQITTTPLIRIDGVANVLVKGFRVRTLSHETYDTQTMDGIVASGATGVGIQGNDLGWAGDPGDRSNLSNGIVLRAGATGVVRGNVVKDPLNDGIHATDSGTDVTILGNTIDIVFAGSSSAGDDGIEVRTAATARVTDNTILVPAVQSGIITKLSAGVELFHANGSTVVRDNTIRNPISGIVTRGNGYDLLDNLVIGRQVGINIVDSDNLTITGNRARATIASPGYGIAATEASDGSVIAGNDVTDSAGPDCFEQNTIGGIDNAWSQNLHDDGVPAGLCTDADVPA